MRLTIDKNTYDDVAIEKKRDVKLHFTADADPDPDAAASDNKYNKQYEGILLENKKKCMYRYKRGCILCKWRQDILPFFRNKGGLLLIAHIGFYVKVFITYFMYASSINKQFFFFKIYVNTEKKLFCY